MPNSLGVLRGGKRAPAAALNYHISYFRSFPSYHGNGPQHAEPKLFPFSQTRAFAFSLRANEIYSRQNFFFDLLLFAIRFEVVC